MDLAAVDLPLYGTTSSPDPSAVTYGDWVNLLVDFLAAEDDGRPLLLLGAGMGGLLSCEVTARSGRVAHVVGTCLLNPRDWPSRAVMTRFRAAGMLSGPLARLIRGRAHRVRIPLRWLVPLSRVSRDPALSRLCARDPRGGAVRVPLGFLVSYLVYRHIPVSRLPVPVTLVHPAEDAWTPVEVSARWLRGMTSGARVVMLRNCGHFPVEEPGLTELVDVVTDIATASGRLPRI